MYDAFPQDWRQECSNPAVGLSSVVVCVRGNAFCSGPRHGCLLGKHRSSKMPVILSTRRNKSSDKKPTAGSRRNGHKGATLPTLKFSNDNAKLGPDIVTFSLPSGHTCPGACTCLSKVDFKTNKLVDGPQQTIRCFSAAQEVAFKNTRLARRYNFALLRPLKTAKAMCDLILRSLPTAQRIVRVHVGGDFYNQTYFDAWQMVAEARPKQRFYAYTKSIPFWRNWLNRHGALAKNFFLTASLGGKFDDLILPEWITASIVSHPKEAKRMRLEIDHDDSHAYNQSRSFALLVHGMQPPGSEAAAAIKTLRAEGIQFSYSRNK